MIATLGRNSGTTFDKVLAHSSLPDWNPPKQWFGAFLNAVRGKSYSNSVLTLYGLILALILN